VGQGQNYFRATLIALVVFSLLFPLPSSGYSVLTHEAIIDSAWDSHIRPLLLQRFPTSTHEQLRQAHGYAYGGAIIQDMGYYPHGSKLVSNLTHYVRSGDFVDALLRDARDLDEYAFALGALSHYVADNVGHKLAVNVSVPVLYPRLERKYGPVVTYEDDPLAHIKAEFGFDVLEVAQERYAPDRYHDFIGFYVSQRLLDQAFLETYGLDLQNVLVNEPRAIDSYRRAVSSLIPKATRVAWSIKKKEIQKGIPGMTKKKFLYNLSRASYEKHWGNDYQKPTFIDNLLAVLYIIIPKIGPLKILTFRTPTPETEKFFERSFNATLDAYRSWLTTLREVKPLNLANLNIDVDEETPRGKYHLYDKTCAELLSRLADKNFANTTPELRTDLLRFFSEPPGPDYAKRNKKYRERLESNLQQLRVSNLASGPRLTPVGNR
jgi:hypothetical protein